MYWMCDGSLLFRTDIKIIIVKTRGSIWHVETSYSRIWPDLVSQKQLGIHTLADSLRSSGVTRVVSPGAATEGVAPIFSWENWRPFLVINVCQFCGITYLFSPAKTDDLFSHHCHFLLISLGYHPLTPHLFYLSGLVCPLFSVNLPTKSCFSFGCHPLENVTRGGPPLRPSPPPHTPSDATVKKLMRALWIADNSDWFNAYSTLTFYDL